MLCREPSSRLRPHRHMSPSLLSSWQSQGHSALLQPRSGLCPSAAVTPSKELQVILIAVQDTGEQAAAAADASRQQEIQVGAPDQSHAHAACAVGQRHRPSCHVALAGCQAADRGSTDAECHAGRTADSSQGKGRGVTTGLVCVWMQIELCCPLAGTIPLCLAEDHGLHAAVQ